MTSLTQRPPRGGSIVVIGGGASAVALLNALGRGEAAHRVTVVDPRPVGLGVAFGTDDPRLRCNTSVDVTAVQRDDTSDLLRYLATRGWPVRRADFVPRALVGQYCRERFVRASRLITARGGTVRHVPRRAVAVHGSADAGYLVVLDDGSRLPATDVVVTAGGGEPVVPEVLRPHAWHPAALPSPYPTGRLRALPPDARVLVVGSKLSAVDAALVLCRRGRQVTLASPSGMLPAVRRRLCRHRQGPAGVLPALAGLDPAATDFGERLTRVLVRAVRGAGGERPEPVHRQMCREEDPLERLLHETTLAESETAPWQDVVAELIEAVNTWTSGWTPEARGRLLADNRTLISRYVSALPVSTATELSAFAKEDRLTVRRGMPTGLQPAPDGGWSVNWADGGTEWYSHTVAASGFRPPRPRVGGGALLSFEGHPDATGPQDAGAATGAPPPRPGRGPRGAAETAGLELDQGLRLLCPGSGVPERVWLMGAPSHSSTAIVNYLWTAASQAETVAGALGAPNS